ncbi:MAG: DUF4112 domain-containing protein [Nitrospiraceae bacterium]
MVSVRAKEEQAEWIAHLLDDAVHLPHTRIRFGLDPVMGLVPVVGDLAATVAGSFVLVIARQLGIPTGLLFRMAYSQLLNGLIGSVPLFGDLFSFTYKSNAKNAALLVRRVKRGEAGVCPLEAPALSLVDLGLVLLVTGPVWVAVAALTYWFWSRNLTLLSILF